MIRVLTPIAIALFFIGYPPFHRLRSSKVVLVLMRLIYRVLSVQRPSKAMRCLHWDEITVSPRAPNPTASLDWLDPDRAPASGRKALAPSSSSRRRVQNRGCIDGSLQ